ncbi:hypothetical protein JCM1841_001051 [Sporobolomyces salmonicolor]
MTALVASHASICSPSKRSLSPIGPLDAPSPKRVALHSPGPLPAAPAAAQGLPLTGSGTSNGGAASLAGTGGGAGAAGCRLLWRGKVLNEQGIGLYGIAFIAHLFSVSSSASPHPSFSPFEDPFASSTRVSSSGADMCLGLEMLRGAAIRVLGEVKVLRADYGGEPDARLPEKVPSNAKGKAKEVEIETVRLETPTDVRVYVDERCPETVEWFEERFCREGKEGWGVKIDAGGATMSFSVFTSLRVETDRRRRAGEEVVIFASYPDLSMPSATPPSAAHESEDVDPTASTSASQPRPPLSLLLGRPVKPAGRTPRPDDPLPRENLFTAKLRKTASLPASAFASTAGKSAPVTALFRDASSAICSANPPKQKRQTAKDKAIASLLGKNSQPAPSRANSRPPPPVIAFPVPPLPPASGGIGLKRTFPRSDSSSRLFGNLPSATRQSSLPPPQPLSRRSSVSLAPSNDALARPFQRSRSSRSSAMSVDSPPSSDSEFPPTSARLYARAARGGSRAPSPTFSVASTSFGGLDEEGEAGVTMEENESLDGLGELRSLGARPGGGAQKRGMGRSSSLPVGKFLGGTKSEKVVGRKEKDRRERQETALPPAAVATVGATTATGDQSTLESRNKNTVKKLALNRLTALGVGKDHGEFRDVFSMVTRGVAFAMRSTFKTDLLCPSDRRRAEDLIGQHLRLYLPESYFASSAPSNPPSCTAGETTFPLVHVEIDVESGAPPPPPAEPLAEPPSLAAEAASLPSPKSLGDGLDEPNPVMMPEGDDHDLEMEATQLVEGETQ